MALLLATCPSCRLGGGVKKPLMFSHKIGSFIGGVTRSSKRRSFIKMVGDSSCPFQFPQQPILKEAFKEPVAFLGGMFAGLLRLDLNEDPLKEWVSRTVEASGLTEDIEEASTLDEEVPQQIEIE